LLSHFSTLFHGAWPKLGQKILLDELIPKVFCLWSNRPHRFGVAELAGLNQTYDRRKDGLLGFVEHRRDRESFTSDERLKIGEEGGDSNLRPIGYFFPYGKKPLYR
jgi:hypothetical protein